MTHEVYISYSHKDKPIADGICANLEGAGVRCWIAPRDIGPGEDWPTSIARAIPQSRVMVLVFSSNSNTSAQVYREMFLAFSNNVIIIPFKIEDVEPEPRKGYILAGLHWLDAMNPPTKEHIQALIDCVKALLPARETPPVGEVQPTTPPHVGQPIPGNELPQQHLPELAPRKKVAWVRYLWIPGALILLSLASLLVFNFLNRPATTAKVGPSGVLLFGGPGENYSMIDFVFTDYVTIIGQAYHCAWFEVSVKSGSGLEHGWVDASKVTYHFNCSEVSLADIPPTPGPNAP